MQFPLAADLLARLPRNPEWKYERIGGQACLSYRPRPLEFRRATDLPVGPLADADVEIRMLDPERDRPYVARLLLEVWVQEAPYVTFEDPVARLEEEIARSLSSAELGAVAIDAQHLCAAVLAPWRSLIGLHGPTDLIPTLEWLTVHEDSRDRGLATGLLGVVVDALAARGVRELASAASPTNLASLRWHLTRGFRLQPDPIRAALSRSPASPPDNRPAVGR